MRKEIDSGLGLLVAVPYTPFIPRSIFLHRGVRKPKQESPKVVANSHFMRIF